MSRVHFMLATLLVAVGVPGPLPGLMSFKDRGEALGRADLYGYVRMSVELGDLPVGNGQVLPLYLVFTSDPKHNPGAFGPGWRLPLADSSVTKYNNYGLVWEGPDEKRYFFVPDRETARVRDGSEMFIHMGRKWSARMSRNGDILIEGKDNPFWTFDYRGGRLHRFRLGEDSDSFRIQYSSRGYPQQIMTESNRQGVFEIEYRGNTPVRIRVMDKLINLEMGDGEMMSPDGKTEYGRYRLSFLRSLDFSEEERKEFIYKQIRSRQREVSVDGLDSRGRASRANATKQQVRIPLNRLLVKQGKESISMDWESTSGFIVADETGTYEIENRAYDPHTKNPDARSSRVRISPGTVSIKKLDEEVGEWLYAYDWQSGVRTEKNPITGKSTRKTYIMAEGPAHTKLRKSEIDEGGGWQVVDYRAYDSLGRLIRRIQGENSTIWNRDSEEGIVHRQRFKNGQLWRSSVFKNGKLVERIRHRENGNREIYHFAYIDGMRHVTHWINEDLRWEKKYYPDNRIAEIVWPDGSANIYEYLNEGVRMIRVYSGGEIRDFFRQKGDKKYVRFEPDELINF